MKTYMANTNATSTQYLLVDARGKILGRLASQIATRLRGKHKPEYTPNVNMGDYIIIINADKLCVTGKKLKDKQYYHHSGYPGGLKSINFFALREKCPRRVLELAVKGMLPKGPLGRKMFRKLKIYTGDQHPHQAQQPRLIRLQY